MWLGALLGLIIVGGLILATIGIQESEPWPGLFQFLFGIAVAVVAGASLTFLAAEAAW